MEPGQQFEQEHSGCVEDDLFEISEDYSTKLGVYGGGGNCFGGVKVKVGTDTAESTNVMVAGFRLGRYLIRKEKMFVEYEATVASRLSSVY